MNELNREEVLNDLLNALKAQGEIRSTEKDYDTDEDYVEVDGQIYTFFITIEITERPYISYYRKATYWPVDQASPAESETSGKFRFYITKITCFNEDGDEYNLSDILTPEDINTIEANMDFDEDEFTDGVDDLYESRKIRISEQDIIYMVKRAINEVASKRTAINRIYKVTHEITGNIYRDDSWNGPRMVVDAIKSLGYDCGLGAKDGGYRKSSDGMAQWKEYQVEIDTPEGFQIHGTLNCHAAGSMEDPFDRYDMSLVLW